MLLNRICSPFPIDVKLYKHACMGIICASGVLLQKAQQARKTSACIGGVLAFQKLCVLILRGSQALQYPLQALSLLWTYQMLVHSCNTTQEGVNPLPEVLVFMQSPSH